MILSGAAAAPRVDVEPLLMCDVLPDGTTAGQVLVEPVYDTSSGERIGTRTVDPVTGDPYTVTGTLGPCAVSQDCAELTTPTATVGLCLADGTPIAVTIVRDCTGAVTSEGWIHLTSGAYSAGAPPAGAVACGDSRSVQVSGTFCDIDDAGDVVGLVLIEYSYAADGTIDTVRLVDATTGDTYTPAGTVTTCPAGVGQPERDVVQLCDINDDESGAPALVTPFLRDFARDENGAVVGHSDYTLDGAPYTPAGTVGVCHPPAVEPCASTVSTLRLCDLNPEVEPDADGKRCAVPFLRHLVHDCTGAVVETRDTAMDGTTLYAPVQVVDCGSGGVPAMVEVPWEVVGIQADPDSVAGRGFLFSLSPIDDPDTVGVVKVTTTSTANTACAATPPNYSFANPTTYTFQPDQALQDAATYVRVDLQDFDTFEPITGLSPAPSRLGGTAYWDGTTVRPTVNDGTGEMYYDGPPAQWSYRVGNTGGGLSCSALSFAAISLRTEGCCAPCGGAGGDGSGRTVQEVCVIANAAPANVMTWTRVIEDGGATIYYLDQGGARFDSTLPAGHQIVACPVVEPEPCASSTTVGLCDSTPVDFGALVVATATDPTPYFQTGDGVTKRIVLADPQPLFDGGTLVVDGPAGGEPGPEPVHRYAAALLALPAGICPPCGDWPDTMTLTVAARATNNGPVAGNAVCGRYTLFNGATILGENEIRNTPVGGFSDFSVSATVSYADMVAGTIALKMDLETRHLGDKSWTVEDFTITLEAVQTGCGTPFLRTIRRDCVTGELVDVLDTDYDGQPYTPVGEVASCTAHSTCGSGGQSGAPSTCEQCTPLVLCDVVATGDPVVFLRTVCQDCTGSAVTVTDTELDGVTPYTVAGSVTDCGRVGDCPTSYSSECWRFVEAQVSYDNTVGPCGTILPASMGACAGNWRITSWIIDGVEQITGAPAQFVSTGCGGNANQFHGAWAQTLGAIDPTSTWQPAYNGSCLHYIRTASVDPNRVYGQMVMFRTEAPNAIFTLGPAASRSETEYTKTYVQECDGTTTVTWLDADGAEIEEPEGELTFCGATTPIDPTDPDDGQAVSTGVRAVTGTAVQDLVAEFTDVQSVSLTVLAGAVAVTMTDGTDVTIPAGVSMTWSVSQPSDTALAAASFAGADASASFLLNWTYLS